ncbi:hypothetical protein DL991_10170 [Amycolatopsis sp. WAC 01375]|uniref:hypothetical protein n=1 Tax=Amycolatopsis sp. WAC 01375 TaxID=2203194 RepID=UPI000F77BC39|nr:hypothetical protein [Amycolatopsis sp. WAC 01375]RSM80485.1 hypothetical protein DL991_10170 [Amycolatopsis sp. WAC 01375]
MIRLASVNAFKLYGDPADEARFAHVEEMIRRTDADIVAVQEIVAHPPKNPGDPGKRDLAKLRVQRLAHAVGLRCDIDGEVMCALGGGNHHAALLWRAGARAGKATITPVTGKIGRFERVPAGMWHSFVTAVFDLDGKKLRVGNGQLSHVDPGIGWGWADAGQVMRAMNGDEIAGLVAADWNGVGATKVMLNDGGETDYDPDPYHGIAWHPDHAYQFDEYGRLDRSAALRLEGPGRFRDCARIANVPWKPTTGRFPGDKHPPRRIDRWYATHHFPDDAVIGLDVLGAELVGHCTDHDPLVVEVDETKLA